MKKVFFIAILFTIISAAVPTYAFQPTAIDPHVEFLTPGVTRSFTITQYNNFPQGLSSFLVFLLGYGPVKITISSQNEGDLLVILGWAVSSAGIEPIFKVGKSNVILVESVEIGSERYPTGIMWFSSWIASPVEEEIKYYLTIVF